MRLKDLLAQQGLQKASCDEKPTDIAIIDWIKMEENVVGLIRLCISDDVMNHILDLTTPNEEHGDLQAHVNAFNNILANLTRLGVKVDNEDKAIVFLCSLSSSYNHLVTTLTHEKRDYPNKSANVVQDNGSCSEEDLLCVSSAKYTDAWILNSRCSYHMTPHREWLNFLKACDFSFVYLGDDITCSITRKGKIKIALDDGGTHILSEVCYVPELRKNFISLDTLQVNVYSFRSDGDKDIMKVIKGEMTMMTTRKTADNIYKLLGAQLWVM
ncbi:unnamed protein product [Vicia faba]|uniref:Retrovirus-related Pol polyprotein from transposon TNT 1-94-like beta-barrel domain-containing protein n=1 Tax=Vicia faba TaxID=3906 RepID=A0AAV0YIG5_VICFA|nr:unnamed protein product [Vicia faba]